MKDVRDVFSALAALEKTGGRAAMATVIRTTGSVPRRPGSKMLVYRDGKAVGTVGGGAMEARVVEEALKVMQTGTRQSRLAIICPILVRGIRVFAAARLRFLSRQLALTRRWLLLAVVMWARHWHNLRNGVVFV